jgi:hypothetical protein
MKKIKMTIAILLFISNSVFADDDTSFSLFADYSSSSIKLFDEYCGSISGITMSAAEQLSQVLGVSYRSIEFQRSGLTKLACCISVDTPKGIIRFPARSLFANKKGKLIAGSLIYWYD